MQPLLLLHGAIGSQDQLVPLKEELKPYFDIHCFNFPGHGGDDCAESFSMHAFTKATVAYCEKHELKEPLVFGYSMGGYVALLIESQYPGTFKKIVTLGTKYEWSEDISAKEIKMLRPDVIEQKVPAFAQQLANRHGNTHWKDVLHKTASMLLDLGKHPLLTASALQKVSCPTMLLLGDKDNMVSQDETQDAANHLSHGQFQLIPNTPHPIEQVDVSVLSNIIHKFLVDH